MFKCGCDFIKNEKLQRDKSIKTTYVEGVYHPQPNAFARLTDANISLPKGQDDIFPYRITFELESLFSREETPQASGENLRFIEKHDPLSVSLCANIAHYEKAKWYVSTGDEYIHVQIMVAEMLAYMNEISDHIYNLLLQSFQPTFQSLTAKSKKM